MSKTITEAELHTIDLVGFSEALLISDQEDKSGVLAYDFHQMAPLCAPDSDGTPVAKQLLVLVDGEVDGDALARVASILNARTGRL